MFQYDGKMGEIYKIFLLNILLGLFTLGIYHFWGKTRLRRYISSSIMLNNDRFEYTGLGKELFLGFIKALVILIILSIPFIMAIHQLEPLIDKLNKIEKNEQVHKKESDVRNVLKHQNDKMGPHVNVFDTLTKEEVKQFFIAFGIIGLYIIFYYIYLPFVAVYGSLQYRTANTLWRGIRGHMIGSTLIYGLLGLFHTFLKLITLGLWIPFADVLMFEYKMNRLSFGDKSAIFQPIGTKLFITHLLTILVSVIIAIMLFYILYIQKEQLTSVLNYFIIIAFILLFLAPRYWYKAALIRIKYNQLKFGNLGFKCTISGFGLLKQLWINYLILILTLGLGYPIVTQRRMRFFCRHVILIGDIEKAHILQAPGAKNKWGEGFSSALDINIGLF